MAYRVPPDDVVVGAAKAMLRSAKSIVSQRELRHQVARVLRKMDPRYAIGEDRLRRLLAVQPFVRLELRARKGSREKVLTRCPVCRSSLQRLKNQTLFGGEVTLTLRCSACGYWTGKEKRVPTLYIFHYQGAGNGPAPAQEFMIPSR